MDEFDHHRLGTVADFRSKWLDFLDLDPANHPQGTIIQPVLSSGGPSVPTWSVDPDDYYDTINTPEHSNVIELTRMDNSTGLPVDVVVDRFDYESGNTKHNEFKDDVEDMSPAAPHPERTITMRLRIRRPRQSPASASATISGG